MARLHCQCARAGGRTSGRTGGPPSQPSPPPLLLSIAASEKSHEWRPRGRSSTLACVTCGRKRVCVCRLRVTADARRAVARAPTNESSGADDARERTRSRRSERSLASGNNWAATANWSGGGPLGAKARARAGSQAGGQETSTPTHLRRARARACGRAALRRRA